MGEAAQKSPESAAPAWQQAAAANSPGSSPGPSSDKTTLDQARRFLQDETVRSSSREKKMDFLRSKGLEGADIAKLLDDEAGSQPPAPPATDAAPEAREEQGNKNALAPTTADSQLVEVESKTKGQGHPPIVTYPEFLAKPIKPPPLITASGLFNSLGVVAGLSTLVYGAAKYMVSPMVDSLTESRIALYQGATKNITRLVQKLEDSVSEIPPALGAKKAPTVVDGGDDEDSVSSYDDPSELFHRDVGVQTSRPSTPRPSDPSTWGLGGPPSAHKPSATAQQAERIKGLVSSVRILCDDFTSQAEELADAGTVMNTLSEDLQKLTYPPESFGIGMGSSYLYGTARNEPDDEVKRAKDNIRRVKGVLLSTRTFPSTTR